MRDKASKHNNLCKPTNYFVEIDPYEDDSPCDIADESDLLTTHLHANGLNLTHQKTDFSKRF
jgi:hypothetical protein